MTIPLSIHEKYMQRCLELAGKGLGRTGTNPLVGCVIVKNDRIIGEGFHRQFGGPHAEVVAINSVKEKSFLAESTLYVNLEPCSHYGKTPPCSVLIKNMQIPRVVIGSLDPNPKVAGKGIEILKAGGVNVITDILESEASCLNKRFFTLINKKRPYIILKWAESHDGFLDKIRTAEAELKPNWITNETARMLVHKWRSEEAAIMVGVNTVLTDNPRLNIRDWPGNNQPIRILIDRNGRIDDSFHVIDESEKTIVFTIKDCRQDSKIEYIRINKDTGLEEILMTLGEKGIISMIVEGGGLLLKSFIDLSLWDEARVFTGNFNFHSGIEAPVIPHPANEAMIYRNNRLQIYQLKTVEGTLDANR